LAPVLPPTYSPETLRVSAGTTYLGDDTKARRQLGFDPRPLEVGLRGTLEAEMRALDSGP
jgi:dihydroflavonol-4-reductase